MAGKPIPGFLCRVLTPQVVLLSMQDRAWQVKAQNVGSSSFIWCKEYIRTFQVVISDDRLSLTGFKFYCTTRANHSVGKGTWYFETRILDMKEGAATRIGWAQRFANLQVELWSCFALKREDLT